MELGQTRDAILAQHGPATEENHSKNTAVYRTGPWKVDVEYRGGIVCKLIFARIGQLSEVEIQSILTQNAGGAEWRELEANSPKRSWQRTDFAAAECDRVKPHSLTLMQAPPGAEISASPAMVDELSFPMPALAEESTPSAPYALERHAVLAPPARHPFRGLVAVLGALVRRYPLAFIIPSVLLLAVWLFGRGQKKSVESPTPSRRVVQPRPTETVTVVTPKPAELTLDGLEPDAFDLLVGEIFRRKGYDVEMSGGVGSDGGNDLTLRKGTEVTLVQCRHWSNWKVSAPSVRDLIGTIAATGAANGIFVTSGHYTRDAQDLAREKPIRLVDRGELDQLIAEVSAPGENLLDFHCWMDRFASSVMVVDPTCPFCHRSMKLTRGFQGRPYWSCQTFPSCAGKREGRAELLGTRAALG
jgi:restriction system protein